MEQRVKELRKLGKESIALRLKAYRKQHGYSQESLAELLRIGRNNISRWENCDNRITTTMLRLLVEHGVL